MNLLVEVYLLFYLPVTMNWRAGDASCDAQNPVVGVCPALISGLATWGPGYLSDETEDRVSSISPSACNN